MALQSFDTAIKRRVRSEYREFLKRTVLRHRRPKDVKVLCLPGWEAVEVFEVYDRLGIPRSNIYGVEYKREAYDRLVARKLGINLWHGDVFDLLDAVGIKQIKARLTPEELVFYESFKANVPAIIPEMKDYPVNVLAFEANDKVKELAFETSVKSAISAPAGWDLKFDIIALDICGHVTSKVMGGISSCFRGMVLNDRGVFTLTSLASREQELTKILIRMAMLMDAIIRGTISEQAVDARPEMVTAFGIREDDYQTMIKERTGLEALVILLALGNDSFKELLRIYQMALSGNLLLEMPKNNIFDAIMAVEADPSAMICRKIERFSYQSEHSKMRTAFMEFRTAQKAIRETGSEMETIAGLMHGLGSRVVEVEQPKQNAMGRQEIMTKIMEGQFVDG